MYYAPGVTFLILLGIIIAFLASLAGWANEKIKGS
jgi:hypothetical protein